MAVLNCGWEFGCPGRFAMFFLRPCRLLLSLPICLLCLSSFHIWCKIFPIVHSASSRVSYKNLFGGGCLWIFLSIFFHYFFIFIFLHSELNFTSLLYIVADKHFVSKWIFLCLFSRLVPWKDTKRLRYTCKDF